MVLGLQSVFQWWWHYHFVVAKVCVHSHPHLPTWLTQCSRWGSSNNISAAEMTDRTHVRMLLLLQNLQDWNNKCFLLWFAKCLHGLWRHTVQKGTQWKQSTAFVMANHILLELTFISTNELQWNLISLQAKWNMSSLASEIVTNIYDTSPRSSGAAASTWLPSYLQAFVSASFLVSNNGLNSKHLTYINVVSNTKNNIFFLQSTFFNLDYYNIQPPGGAQILLAPLRSALLFRFLYTTFTWDF